MIIFVSSTNQITVSGPLQLFMIINKLKMYSQPIECKLSLLRKPCDLIGQGKYAYKGLKI